VKKKILLMVLVVCLVLGGISGVIYANSEHEYLQGNKLVGHVWAGALVNESERYSFIPYFHISNLDCSKDITINQLSVIASYTDDDGELITEKIYEGSLIDFHIKSSGERGNAIINTLAPHQSFVLDLGVYLGEYAEWRENNPRYYYTVEIFWESEGAAIPLTGWQSTWTFVSDPNTGAAIRECVKESPMVNVKQRGKFLNQ
jgi:hypothetical protein